MAVYYRIIDREMVQSSMEKFGEDGPGVGFLTMDEAESLGHTLGIDDCELEICRRRTKHFHAGIESREGRSVILINAINRDDAGEFDRVAFLLRRDRMLLLQIEDADDSVREGFESVVSENLHDAVYADVMYDMFAKFLESGEDMLDDTEEQTAAMEEGIAAGKLGKELNQRICALRNTMLRVERYYDELVDVGEALQTDEGDIFDDTCKRFFRRFTAKAGRLESTARLLSENLAYLRESLSAALDYNMNFTMKIFTVASVVFLPLTLIVGWYGMNFDMPELTWKYGYIGVIALCAAVVLVCIAYFKRKKYF